MKFRIGLILLALLLFSGCRAALHEWQPCCRADEAALVLGEDAGLADALEAARLRREGILKVPKEDILPLVQGREEQTVDISRLASAVRRAEIIAYSAALEDFNLLADIIRQIYGAYNYFGGDGVFLPIFDEVRATLQLREYWPTSDFATLIFDALSENINDNHFMLDDELMGNEFAPEENFRLSLSDAGEFYYSNQPQKPFERLEFENVSLRCHYGFPVITIRQMGFPDGRRGSHGADARRFLSYAVALRDEPVIIVDIRSNGGGNGNLPIRWLHALTGEIIAGNYWGIEGRSYESFVDAVKNQGRNNPFYSSYENFRVYVQPEPLGEYNTLLHNLPDEIVANNQLLILLIDRGTASAAEGFADLAFNLENALVIGQNTAGALHTNMTYPRRYLPNSGITFGLGRGIHIHPPGHLPEGIGITPDIWTDGDALKATLAMLNKNFIWE
ncbi:MAG: hypothetical protein LBE35_02680 [Clostridiales bacterium]|jgi:hypothetical protein|nr:hypothetical protein [Clostridiales bacterium]